MFILVFLLAQALASDVVQHYPVENANVAKSVEEMLFQNNIPIQPVVEQTDGTLLVNMDEILTKDQFKKAFGGKFKSDTADKKKRTVAIRGNSYRWPNGEVPFVLDDTFSTSHHEKWVNDDGKFVDTYGRPLTNFKEMVAWYKQVTCVRFVPYNGQAHYLSYNGHAGGCSSAVGRQTNSWVPADGKQTVNLNSQGCAVHRGTTFHETMHALGIYHEQERPDRKDHVRIEKDNMIHPDNYHNFENLATSEAETFGLPYDFTSLVHYDLDQFGRQKTKYPPAYTYLQTIFPIRERNAKKFTEGQNRRFPSFLDANLINLMYGCGSGCGGRCSGFFTTGCRCVTRAEYFRNYCSGDEEVGWCLKYRLDNGLLARFHGKAGRNLKY